MSDLDREVPMGWYAGEAYKHTKSDPIDCRWCHAPLDRVRSFLMCPKCDGVG